MGLLDDAIREHLELKRRRGADPAEVEKQEREALGPIGAAPVVDREPPVTDDEPPLEAATYDDDPPAAGYDDASVPLDEERAALRDPAAYDDDPDPFADAHEPLRDEPAGAVRAPDPPAREEPPGGAQPTEQFSAEDVEELRRGEASGEEPPPEGEDVLDETPDFLQEAPEHDRLWFEQRPPRDFDF